MSNLTSEGNGISTIEIESLQLHDQEERKAHQESTASTSKLSQEDKGNGQATEVAVKKGNPRRSNSSFSEDARVQVRDRLQKHLTSSLLDNLQTTVTPAPSNRDEWPENQIDFDFIMSEPILRALFRNFLRINYSEPNLDFWKCVELYKHLDQSEMANVGAEIIEEYLLSTSESELNVSHEHRSLVTELESKEFTASSFDLLQLEIFYLMKRDSFMQFKQSPQCQEVIETFNILRCNKSAKSAVTHLTERDVKKIFSGGETVTLPQDTELVAQGDCLFCLYKLNSGQIRATRTIQGESFQLPAIADHSKLIGEHFLLSSTPSDVTLVTKTKCELECVNHSFIFHLMESNSELTLRFYREIGRSLAVTLNALSSLERDPKRRISISSNIGTEENHDADVCASFNVEEHVIINEYPCTYYRLIPRKGKMYITKSLLLFYAKIFTQKTKERVRISSITSIEHTVRGTECELKIKAAKKKFKFTMKTEHVQQLLPILEDLRGEGASLSPRMRANTSPAPAPDEIPEGQFLSSADWDVILAGVNGKTKDSSFMTFSDGDFILEEGSPYRMICQITSGTCRIQKRVPNTGVSVVLCKVKEGEMIGEINFLCGGNATASVVAEGKVDMYVIGPAIQEIAESDPPMAARFYQYLSYQIGERISQRYAEGWGSQVDSGSDDDISNET